MNPKHEAEIFTRQLERLVDGELSPQEYRALLAQLDTIPSGWRQCGLAFLEAQAIQHAIQQDVLGMIQVPPTFTAVPTATTVSADTTTKAATTVAPHATQQGSMAWASLFSVAASLVLAFFLGRGSLTTSPVAKNTTPSPTPPSAPLEIAESEMSVPTPRQIPAGRFSLLVNDEPNAPHTRELPAYEADQLEPQMFTPLNDLSHEVEAAFRNAGLHVERREQWVPFALDEHRQMLVPVHRVHVEPQELPVY
jgi:hypothetical protein